MKQTATLSLPPRQLPRSLILDTAPAARSVLSPTSLECEIRYVATFLCDNISQLRQLCISCCQILTANNGFQKCVFIIRVLRKQSTLPCSIMFAAKTNPKASLATHRGRLQAIKQRYTDGSTYEGGYLNFKKQGKGIISFSNGEKYDGHWAEGLKEGSGVYTWADGSQYIGEWHLDRMSGEGVHVSFNGSKYSGSWSGNLMHGSGSYQYDNGSVYKGEWFEGSVLSHSIHEIVTYFLSFKTCL